VALFADTHGGHKLGLMPPDVVLYDEDENGALVPYTPELTATQKWLWECYEEDLARLEEIAGGDEIILIHNGDATHGDKYPEQLVTTRKADQLRIAAGNLKRAAQVKGVSKMRLLIGTGSHTFGEGSSPLILSDLLQPTIGDVKCLNHGLFSVDGVKSDVAHHGPGAGIRQWTNGNQLRYYVRSLMNDALIDGDKPPDLVVRAHFHTYCRETVRMTTKQGVFKTEALILPSYCGMSAYSRQATRSASRIGCGMAVAEIVYGVLVDIYPLVRVVDLRTKEEL